MVRAAVMDKWIVPWIGDVPLRDLGEDRVQDWRGAIRAAGCSAGQANAALGILSTALSAARRARRVPANPCQGIRRLRVDVSRPRALTPLAVERIRAHLPRPRDVALVSVLAYAGLRPEEALPLRWSDLGRTSVVSRTYTHGELRERTKTGRIRAVEVIEPLAADLEALRPRVVTPDDLVFPSPTGLLLDLAGQHPGSRRDLVNLCLSHPEAKRLAVDTEVGGDPADRPARFVDHPHRSLTQLGRILTRSSHRLDSLLPGESAWLGSLQDSQGGSDDACGQRKICVAHGAR